MRQVRGISRGAVALAIAAVAMFAAVAPSSAASRHHRHFAAERGYHANRVYRAFGAIPGAGFASPSSSGYGYGYGDNSNSYTN